MADKIVSVAGAAAMARAGFWPFGQRTHIGWLETGEPIHAYCHHVIIDMQPDHNRRSR